MRYSSQVCKSDTLSSIENNFATTECLAVVWAVRQLCHYLIGANLTLETAYKPQEWLQTFSVLGVVALGT